MEALLADEDVRRAIGVDFGNEEAMLSDAAPSPPAALLLDTLSEELINELAVVTRWWNRATRCGRTWVTPAHMDHR